MNFRSSKLALFLGAVNGFLFGAAFQPVNDALNVYQSGKSTLVTISLYRALSPFTEHLILILLFTTTSYAAHRLLDAKIKSEIVFWQVVAIIAIGIPSIVFYTLDQFRYISGALRAKLEQGKWGYYPGVFPSQSDIEFGIIFLCLAMTINFFYGALLGQMSRIFGRGSYRLDSRPNKLR